MKNFKYENESNIAIISSVKGIRIGLSDLKYKDFKSFSAILKELDLINASCNTK